MIRACQVLFYKIIKFFIRGGRRGAEAQRRRGAGIKKPRFIRGLLSDSGLALILRRFYQVVNIKLDFPVIKCRFVNINSA